MRSGVNLVPSVAKDGSSCSKRFRPPPAAHRRPAGPTRLRRHETQSLSPPVLTSCLEVSPSELSSPVTAPTVRSLTASYLPPTPTRLPHSLSCSPMTHLPPLPPVIEQSP